MRNLRKKMKKKKGEEIRERKKQPVNRSHNIFSKTLWLSHFWGACAGVSISPEFLPLPTSSHQTALSVPLTARNAKTKTSQRPLSLLPPLVWLPVYLCRVYYLPLNNFVFNPFTGDTFFSSSSVWHSEMQMLTLKQRRSEQQSAQVSPAISKSSLINTERST